MNITHGEVRRIEQTIRNTPSETNQSSKDLKSILVGALAQFEKALNALTPVAREAALSLYLEQIRESTFVFHMAILRLGARSDLLENMSRGKLQARLDQHSKDIEHIALLYQLL